MLQASTVRGNERHFRILLKPLSGSMNVVVWRVEMDISTNETLPFIVISRGTHVILDNMFTASPSEE